MKGGIMIYNIILWIVFVFISGCGQDPSTSPVVINDINEDLPLAVRDALEAGLDQVEVPGGQDDDGLSKPSDGIVTLYHIDYVSPIRADHEKPADISCGDTTAYSKMAYKWTTFPLLYTINTAGLTSSLRVKAKNAIIRAFTTWDEEEHPSGLLFKAGTKSTAKITVKWARIDGPGKAAATVATSYDQKTKNPTKTTLTFDTAEKWGVYASASSCVSLGKVHDIENISAHEIGHILGMGHTGTEKESEPATMYPLIRFPGETDKRTLTTGDKAGIKDIYP